LVTNVRKKNTGEEEGRKQAAEEVAEQALELRVWGGSSPVPEMEAAEEGV
jgi:hypothetical protein